MISQTKILNINSSSSHYAFIWCISLVILIGDLSLIITFFISVWFFSSSNCYRSVNSVLTICFVYFQKLNMCVFDRRVSILFFLSLKIKMVLPRSIFDIFCIIECCSNYWIPNNIEGNLWNLETIFSLFLRT
jgi:hypothetical protein